MIHDLPRTFVLSVPRSQARCDTTLAHLKKQGITAEPFYGFDKFIWKFMPELLFEVNKTGERIGWSQVAACLSHYMMWMVLSYLPGDSFWVLEDDAEFIDDWRQQYSEAMRWLPDDWDVVFLGSCCTHGMHKWRRGRGNLYEVKYPMCGHAMMYRKKALPVLLEAHQKVWAPLDIAMARDSLPRLRTYTILPRLVNQRDSYISA